MLLSAISLNDMPNFVDLSAANCSASDQIEPILSENMPTLLRLDLSGSLAKPEQLLFVTESPALAKLQFLNLNRCAVNGAKSFK